MTDVPQGALWVRLPRFIGDGILMVQALEPLRQTGHPLVAWGPESIVDLYRGSNAFAAVHPDEPDGRHVFVLARILRRHRASGVISLARSLRPLLAGWVARVPLRAGWEEGGGRLFGTHTAPWWQLSRHHLDRYRDLIHRAFPDLPDVPPRPLRVRPEAEAAAAELVARHGLEDGFVACALGAHGWNKRLGTAAWVHLARGLEAEGLKAVLLGQGPEDAAQAADILAEAPGPVNLVGALGLAGTAALLDYALGLVGNDSALAHLASAVGCPCVVAFGPTRPEWTAPRGEAVRIVRRDDLACLPCAVHGCATPGHPCMQDLPTDRLLSSLREVLLPRSPAETQARP
jgi:ADP-heptose:LPS heptosyltransferase